MGSSLKPGIRVGLTKKVTLSKHSEMIAEEATWCLRKDTPGKGNRECKGPEAGPRLGAQEHRGGHVAQAEGAQGERKERG